MARVLNVDPQYHPCFNCQLKDCDEDNFNCEIKRILREYNYASKAGETVSENLRAQYRIAYHERYGPVHNERRRKVKHV